MAAKLGSSAARASLPAATMPSGRTCQRDVRLEFPQPSVGYDKVFFADTLGMACKSLKRLERAKGFEPSTPTLARLCSTPELRPLWRLCRLLVEATGWVRRVH